MLVFERRLLDDLGWFNGLCTDYQPYLQRIFAPGVCHFRLRLAAEHDDRVKQVITYVILEHQGRYLFYLRSPSTGEQRLADRGSIGVGGHVSSTDDSLFNPRGVADLYARAVEREVREEVHLDTEYSEEILGIINDDRDDVGRVHIGIVHVWHLARPHVRRRERLLRQLHFATVDEIRTSGAHLESWTALCLDHLEDA